MTNTQKIIDLKTLLAEAKEEFKKINEPWVMIQQGGKECYEDGMADCQCILCKINEALKPEIIIEDGSVSIPVEIYAIPSEGTDGY
jgi:hypothetical protein